MVAAARVSSCALRWLPMVRRPHPRSAARLCETCWIGCAGKERPDERSDWRRHGYLFLRAPHARQGRHVFGGRKPGLGRAKNYLEQALNRRGGIGAPLLAETAKACGYELVLAGRGEALHIDAAPNPGTEGQGQDVPTADTSAKAGNQQPKPRKGSFPLFGSPSVTWDPFMDGQELLAITEPYESPTFYHIGQHGDGTWHVLSVE